jgi:RNA polymerase sigma factor (sigma-70 family)
MNTARTPHDTAGLGLDDLETADLIDLVRSGHPDAYGTLYDRYAYSAHRLARHLGMRDEADDVVSEAFARILDLVKRGKGPADNFRGYLLTTVRHEAAARAKARARVTPTDDDAAIDTAVPFGDNQLDGFEKSTIRAAYESLPERWRTVLWQLEVEGHKPHQVAESLDMSPNSVSALVYRARTGLRQAYLDQHVATRADDASPLCTSTRAKLASLLQQTASARDTVKANTHLLECESCRSALEELRATSSEIGLSAHLPVR